MNHMQLQCPNCDGVSLAQLGGMPTGSAHSGDKFEVTCPHCSENFSIGYITEFKKVVEDATATSSEPSADSSGGGGSELGHAPTPSSDQRSNAMNPNNPAFKAGRDNRSSQLNPNSRAFRSSRGRR